MLDFIARYVFRTFSVILTNNARIISVLQRNRRKLRFFDTILCPRLAVLILKKTYLKFLLLFNTIHMFIFALVLHRKYSSFSFTDWLVRNGGLCGLPNHPSRYDRPMLLNLYCWMLNSWINCWKFRVVPLSLKY